MKKKIVVSGPSLSRSGYGEMCRFALQSLRRHEDEFDIHVLLTNWGNTGNLFHDTEEVRWINSLAAKTQQLLQATNNQPNFDISIQVTIPNEWKKMAAYNIGYTAGIETNMISPAWLQPSQQMDKIIVISEHAKSGFINTVFGDQQGNQFKVTTPVEVCHFPVEDHESVDLGIDFKHDFNFLAVCQWGPRKNLEQTIVNFVQEFKNENVGLVLKVNTANDSIMDKELTETKLKNLLGQLPSDRKCAVHLIHGHMKDEELNALYRHPKIKAIVSSTHGEGFGFPLFEAAYNELPVIATDWSGHLDFLTMKDEDGKDKKMFAKVDYELKPIEQAHVWQGVLEANTQWAYPIQTSLKSRMREVYKDYGRFKSFAKKLNVWVRSEFTEEKVCDKFVEFVTGEKAVKVSVEELPKISIITSVFNGDEYIRPFLEDITRQSIFKEKCELILINANSSGNEESVIQEYIQKYPDNIIYKKLDNDPGIYACWNIAAKLATGEFLTNANLDDRKAPNFMEELAKHLVLNKDVDVIYAENLLTNNANETWEKHTAKTVYPSENFSQEAMLRGNPPHCMPMWRKSLHDKNGYFEESYRSASDWEFWLRSAFAGTKMLKLDKQLGLYYFNPKGMSTNQENNSWKRQEEKEIFKKYMAMSKERKEKNG
jgi:glycosyltransferase involved in cell wall biosynthesis